MRWYHIAPTWNILALVPLWLLLCLASLGIAFSLSALNGNLSGRAVYSAVFSAGVDVFQPGDLSGADGSGAVSVAAGY